MLFPFDNTYAKLPSRFYASVAPKPVASPKLVALNRPLAELLGANADALDAQVLSGNRVPEGAEPIATAYAGHQFGGFSPQLGDGRAILLGEVVAKDGLRRDIQLKGAGRTPWSRGGDGRAALGPVIREYLVSETMFAYGIPTTRALAAVTTGDPVAREELLPGAILTRVAASHIRVGTFQYFASRGDEEAVVALLNYAIARHYPDAASAENPALAFFERVVDAQAQTVAAWLGVGFIHGVMNTDNMSVSGETIDYGPCAFLDTYDPGKWFSSIDRGGRYAFANQPRIAQWNLGRLAETLLPLFADDEETAVSLATERLVAFTKKFESAHLRVLRKKLGLAREEADDASLATDLLERMAASDVDFTLFFRKLCSAAGDPAADADVAALFTQPGAFHDWATRWRARLEKEEGTPEARAASMRLANPAFIPRNHRVEEAIEAAVRLEDFEPFQTLLEVLSHPFDDQPAHAHLAEPPTAEQAEGYRTFCGT